MITTIGAALYADRKRPGVWIIGGVWLFLAVVFGLMIPYLVYIGLSGSADAEDLNSARQLLATVLPDHLTTTGIGLFPLFGGAVVLILGAATIGNEYRWGTLNLLFLQRPSRASVLLGHAVALAGLLLALVAVTFIAVAGASAGIALAEGEPVAFPSAGELATAIGAAWLICLAHGSLGFFLAVVFRSTAMAIAIGLGWTMLIENAVNGLALVAEPLTYLQKILLSPSTGAIAAAIGAPTQFSGGTPGVVAAASGPVACAVAAAYVVILTTASVVVTNRRDATA
jgi:ABC-type transport system involved in multi-copper enzyme maturation permease subunit